MRKIAESIRAKLTLTFIGILVLSCLTALGLMIVAAPSLSETAATRINKDIVLLLTGYTAPRE